jgi:hypothetical protein
VVAHHHLTWEDAEVVVVLAAALHDLGLAVQPRQPGAASLALAALKARELLADAYEPKPRAIVLAETLHAIAAHHAPSEAMTLEAGVLSLADALDMAEGRTRPPANGNGASLPIIDEVFIKKGIQAPVRVEIHARHAAALAYARDQLERHLEYSPLAGLIEVSLPHETHLESPT